MIATPHTPPRARRLAALALCAGFALPALFAQNAAPAASTAGSASPASGADATGAADAGTSAASKLTLTVQDAVKLVEKNSRTLKSTAIDTEIKERAAKYGWNVLLPNVQVAGIMSRANDYSPSNYAMYNNLIAPLHNLPQADTDFADEEAHWTTVGSLSVSWNFNLAMLQAIKAAKMAYEGGKITWEQSQREVTTQIKKIFYGLLLQRENLKIKQATLENSRQRMVQSQTNYRNGAVPELALLQAQVAYQNMVPTVEEAEQSFRQTLDTFAFLLGVPIGTNIELVGDIEPVYIEADADKLLAQYGGNNLDIQSLKNSIETLKVKVAATNLSTWTPSLAVSWGLQPTYIGGDGAWHFYKGLGDKDDWYDSGSLSLTLAWNITNMLPWSSNRQSVKDDQATIAKLELNLEMLLENQKVEVRKAFDTLNQARAQIEAMERNVTLAQRAYDMTMRSYRSGATELLDVRDAEESLNQAKLGQLSKKNDYISALMDLEKALNVGLSQPAAPSGAVPSANADGSATAATAVATNQ